MINRILNIFVILAVFTLVIIFYLILAPVKVIEVQNPENLPVLTPYVKVGEQVIFQFNYTKYNNLAPNVRKEIRCAHSFEFLIEPRRLPVGTHEVELNHTIPLNMPSDSDCQIYIFLSYNVNFFKTQEYLFITEPFEVYNPVYDKLE